MNKQDKGMQRITVRLNPNQMLVLNELTEALNVSYSQLVRTIILDFLSKNEERLEQIIIKSKEKENE